MTTFDWIIRLLKEYGSLFLKGTGYTMAMAVAGTLIGLFIGLFIGVYRTNPSPKNKGLRVLKKAGDAIVSAYVELFRGTPMLVQALLFYYGFLSKMEMPLVSAIIIISINTGAYMAEIVRGGIISVDKGQFEGAHAIGMTHGQTMLHVVLPAGDAQHYAVHRQRVRGEHQRQLGAFGHLRNGTDVYVQKRGRHVFPVHPRVPDLRRDLFRAYVHRNAAAAPCRTQNGRQQKLHRVRFADGSGSRNSHQGGVKHHGYV